jgi:hypothetical protein
MHWIQPGTPCRGVSELRRGLLVGLSEQSETVLFHGSDAHFEEGCSDIDPGTFPRTLVEFEIWWNELTDGCLLYTPLTVTTGTMADRDSRKQLGQIRILDWIEGPHTTYSRKIELGSSISGEREGKDEKPKTFDYFMLYDRTHKVPVVDLEVVQVLRPRTSNPRSQDFGVARHTKVIVRKRFAWFRGL